MRLSRGAGPSSASSLVASARPSLSRSCSQGSRSPEARAQAQVDDVAAARVEAIAHERRLRRNAVDHLIAVAQHAAGAGTDADLLQFQAVSAGGRAERHAQTHDDERVASAGGQAQGGQLRREAVAVVVGGRQLLTVIVQQQQHRVEVAGGHFQLHFDDLTLQAVKGPGDARAAVVDAALHRRADGQDGVALGLQGARAGD